MKFIKDPFLLSLVAVVVIALYFPVQGNMAVLFNYLSYFAVALLFFVHGALLSREAILAGIVHWRLHLFVFCCTFMLFPLLTFALKPLLAEAFPTEIIAGILYLSLLPSTVQSSIAFTSIAKGNVPAAVCSASVSNLAGVFLTPVLVSVLMKDNASGVFVGGWETIKDTVLQIFVPFLAGHLLHSKIGGWMRRQRMLTTSVDNGTILLVVFIAFSESMVSNTWGHISVLMLLKLILICCLLLGIVMVIIYTMASVLKFSRADKIAILFCGSKKTLANGLPMAKIIFSGIPIAGLILPLMIFHQVQLMVCSFLAQRFRKQAEML